MEILHDQEYFAGALDLPSKEFMKKCDTYMKLKSNNGRPTPSGLMSPILNGSHSPFHPQGPPFSQGSNPGSGVSTPRGDDSEIRLVPQRSDPALSRGRSVGSEGHQYRAPSPGRRKHNRDSRSLERGVQDMSPHPRQGSKLSTPHPGLVQQSQSHSQSSYLASPASLTGLSQDIVTPRPRVQDQERSYSQRGEPANRLSGDYYPYSPSSETHSSSQGHQQSLRPR